MKSKLYILSDLFEFHHIGVATDDMGMAKEFYLKIGYEADEETEVPSQKVRVCFLTKSGQPQIELITSSGDNSPVLNILKKCGSGPYHFCYSVRNMAEAIEYLRRERFVILFKPEESNAIENNNITFVYKKSIGLIEIVEIV